MDEKSFLTKESKSESDVIDFYDQYAKNWDQRFGEKRSTTYFLEKRWQSFVAALEGTNKRENGLELGAGTGVYIQEIAKYFNRVVAVDGSRQMLFELEKKLNHFRLTNVQTLQSNVTELVNVNDESVDVVMFFGLIEHILEVNTFLSEIKRVLKPGGCVIGVMPNAACPWYSIRNLFRGTSKHCSSDHYYTEKELELIFSRHGMSKDKIIFWGGVPAGIGDLGFRILQVIEKVVEISPFKGYLGGITFKYLKQ